MITAILILVYHYYTYFLMGEIGNYTEKGVKYILSNSVTLNSWY